MSNKKNLNKADKKVMNRAAKKKEKQKKIIIGAVAAAIAVALVLVGVFVIKPFVQKKIEEKRQEQINASMPAVKDAQKYEYNAVDTPDGLDNNNFNFVEYRNLIMPDEMAELLNQAEEDNAEACRNQGIALVIGEHQVSAPRFEIYYFEESIFTIAKLINQVQNNNNVNNTGYDFNKSPAEQEYRGQEDFDTWADKFTDNATNQLTFSFVNFERAAEAGIQLTDTQFRTIMEGYQSVLTYAEENGITPDEYCEGYFGEGATYAMYASMVIMQEYANTYDAKQLDLIAQQVTDEELSAEYDKNPQSYLLASVTLFPVEGEYEQSDLDAINTKQELIDYAAANPPSQNYDAQAETNYAWVTYQSFADAFGEAVAQWIFSSERKIGDIAVVQGTIFPCVIHIDALPFNSYSSEVIVFSSLFDEDITQEVVESVQGEVEGFKTDWENGEFGTADEAGLEYAMNEIGIGERLTCRIGDFDYTADKWIHDPARKYGDYTVLTTPDGVYFIFFVKSNPDDFDWMKAVRYNLAQQKHNDTTQEIIDSSYKVVARNETALANVYSHSNQVTQKFIQNRLAG